MDSRGADRHRMSLKDAEKKGAKTLKHSANRKDIKNNLTAADPKVTKKSGLEKSGLKQRVEK